MIRKTLLLCTFLFASCTTSQEAVYICTGQYAKAYHTNRNCLGLSNCAGEVKEVSLQDAEDIGRHACGFCVNTSSSSR